MAEPLMPPFGVPFQDASGALTEAWRRFYLAMSDSLANNFAPKDAQFWVSTIDTVLDNERNLGALGSGYVKITVGAGVATPSSTPTIPASDLTGTLPALDGSSLTNLNASQLTTGTVPDARFPATLPALSGANLTALNASALASGTIPSGRFPATLPALNGSNLTALNASALASGTVPDARFPATLPALNGSALTSLNASNLASGTVALARLANIADAQIAAAAAIAWSKISKVGSTLADMATRSAADLTSGLLALARGGTGADLSATGGASQVLRQSTAGGAVTVSQLTTADISGLPTLAGTVYTPTLTDVTNLDASTAFALQYARVGDTVQVGGVVGANPTAAGGTMTVLGISLPVASNLGGLLDLGGTGVAYNGDEYAAIVADPVNNRAEMRWLAQDALDHALAIHFTYRVI
jgi:hypothetical protein